MKPTSLLIVLSGAGGALAAGCDANNCLRGVTGTDPVIKQPLSSRLADCSSFMEITVTPAPTTTTSTVTVTSTFLAVKRAELANRQITVSPSEVPTYATYCPASSAYSSACSCAGVTQYTTTAPTPTVIATTTTTSTIDPLAPYECNNPAVCDENAVCGGGCGLCHPDSNGQGYCVGGGFCDDECESNEDCGSGICLDTCCGKVCDTVADNFCMASSAMSLFREKAVAGGQNDVSLA